MPASQLIALLTFLPSPPTLGRGIERDAAIFGTMRYPMAELLTNISNTVDRRKPRVVFADSGSVPFWIVLHH
jgi:hypothetical protein